MKGIMLKKLVNFVRISIHRAHRFPLMFVFVQIFNKIFAYIYVNKHLRWVRILALKSYEIRYKYINRYFDQLFNTSKISETSFTENSNKERTIPKIIWVMWWQGEEMAPAIVQSSITSIRKNFAEYQVNVLTADNYQKYVVLPSKIKEKLENKKITVTNFSDFLRSSLLSKYGGIWLDATIFVSGKVDFSDPFWTIHSNNSQLDFANNPSQGRWSAFAIGSVPSGPLMTFMSFAFRQYWEIEDELIDYFLVDFLIDYAYRKYPEVRREIDQVPINNTQVFQIDQMLMDNKSLDTVIEQLKPTCLHKLSYKHDTANLGQDSIYQQILATR
ncbi:capsular polysaccharide synthesis protein [Lactiplantibacillus plantarum]|uniref:capsular polysaccharide synthesis protein n=1 Tax=Lactiplantibacillus plantarum TaxID=1590 RepID=UPI0005FB4FF7|nr:capsular polysaccharide synthesis protein [Lactiplantibacillus plantarum]